MSDESCEHALYLGNSFAEFSGSHSVEKLQVLAQDELTGELVGGPTCNVEEMDELPSPIPPASFSNVRHDRDCCLAHLRGQLKTMRSRESIRGTVDDRAELAGALPHAKSPEVAHSGPLSAISYQSTTELLRAGSDCRTPLIADS